MQKISPAFNRGIAIEIVLVSAYIWCTASIIRPLFLCSTWILVLFWMQSTCVTKDRLVCSLKHEFVYEQIPFALKGKTLPASNTEFKSFSLTSNSYRVLEVVLFFVLKFTYCVKSQDNG